MGETWLSLNIAKLPRDLALFEDWTTNEGKLSFTIAAVNDTAAPVSGELDITLLDGGAAFLYRTRATQI